MYVWITYRPIIYNRTYLTRISNLAWRIDHVVSTAWSYAPKQNDAAATMQRLKYTLHGMSTTVLLSPHWFTFTFTSRAFSRCFYPKQLTISTFVRRRERTIYLCGYSKDVHRTKCQALTITRLTHSLYTTEIVRIRRYTVLCHLIVSVGLTQHIFYQIASVSPDGEDNDPQMPDVLKPNMIKCD